VIRRFEDFAPPAVEELPWLDRPDASAAIERRLAAGEIARSQAVWLEKWVRDGYAVFPQILPPELAEAINADVEVLHAAHRHLPLDELKKRFENVYVHSAAVRAALMLPDLLARLDLILGTRALPHQTLNLPVSSQQAAHSDQILMTTHPLGYTLAAWFALEDIQADSGPLVIYPGSHRLPHLSAREVGIPRGVSEQECARIYDQRYYALVEREIRRHGFEPVPFLPRRGDVLVWHSNLLHGAQRITRTGATRRSLVAHYFGAGVEHYSDLFQRPCTSPAVLRT
jgi:hypothetical protein